MDIRRVRNGNKEARDNALNFQFFMQNQKKKEMKYL